LKETSDTTTISTSRSFKGSPLLALEKSVRHVTHTSIEAARTVPGKSAQTRSALSTPYATGWRLRAGCLLETKLACDNETSRTVPVVSKNSLGGWIKAVTMIAGVAIVAEQDVRGIVVGTASFASLGRSVHQMLICRTSKRIECRTWPCVVGHGWKNRFCVTIVPQNGWPSVYESLAHLR
jgi:hypothetical protein